MGSVLSSAFFFVLTLAVLIAFHEFGHFWVARRLGVKVLRFSIGFGRPLWSATRGQDRVEYVVAAFPLGGYVKMLDEREGPVAAEEQHRAFNRQPLLSRSAIVLAGPVFNFLLAIVVYWLVFMMGVSGIKPIVGEVVENSIAAQGGIVSGDTILAVGDMETLSWNAAVMALLDRSLSAPMVTVTIESEDGRVYERQLDVSSLPSSLSQNNLFDLVGIMPGRPKIPAVVGEVESGSPSANADLRTGDRIVRGNSETINDWAQWVQFVRARPDQPIEVEVERDGTFVILKLTPARVSNPGGDYGRIGAGVQHNEELLSRYTVNEQFGPLAAAGKALDKTWEISALTLRMLYSMVLGEVSVSNLSGPLSIAQYAGGSASIGVVPYLTFLAIVSISLGILNLLPIPILDGGHLLYYAVEGIRGRPVSEQTEMLGQRIGVAMIMAMMVLALYNDLARIFGG